jgi:carbon storage regulator CsrA
MLVLSRRVGEQIVIDDTIWVTVVAIERGRVRLGVSAPASIRVDRQEVHETRLAPALRALPLPVSFAFAGETSLQTAQQGDRVQVHYVKRAQDGSAASSRGAPLDLTVGIDHPRLPGLGLALVGLAPGATTTVRVPAERAYGPSDSAPRVRRWARTRFQQDQPLPIGGWVRVLDRQGHRRLVRILKVRARTVLVDTQHRWAGQALDLEVKLIGIQDPDGGSQG